MFASLTPGDQLENVFWYRGILSMNFIVAYRLEYHIFGPQRISHVLRIFGEREAKLPIDKVFALVGIAKRYDTDLKQLVDYRIKSDETVLLDLAIFLFDHEEAFEILYLAGIGRGGRNPNLPSWVVDWTMQCANTPLNSEFLPEALRYRAATSKPLRAMRGTSQREIIVRGQLFDKITGLVPLHTNVTGRESFTDIHLLLGSYLDETLKLAREKSRDPYPHAVNQSLDEAVWRTLIGDKTNTERPAPASYAHILARLNQGFADLKDPLSRYFPELRFSEVTKENIRNGNAQIEMEKLLASMESIEQMQNIDILFDSGKGSSPYVFCVTAQGFIGMVPQLSQVEDSIVLLHGMEVPYLLRGGDVKWRYQLVGDAYVHGIMDGEGVSGDGEDFTLV
ncbi:hypothetical protein BU23DRAFT_474330 [Bimuria novae-zelandiae CBS 107.79]|uniref:Heterokaryon incompatibility domain-containing protein n=1 Tax=Bimuria novae-zelandiae CBS 107.79 TaxID=1447943 RepID=A0A6A5V069_9PLEO|nr:hypothetical protein BU23DRAFT_474330 [Bimuria novae-zelandiae CBS 107.79]